MTILSEVEYYNKVYGCWLGKNVGGTLGGPLESAWGKKEMFDVWWYPELKKGGLPNDDLEMQLVWLQALEEKGINIKARDLAEYWLDCIQYNPDEYGLSKTNLKKGLMPPLSGYYNNYFKDCMGSPIRSEIWACIAPGLPNVAAAYAYEDAIVDHAGGESVYGEMFNAALESAAFFITDKEKLLEIGLSFIPPNCETAKAIKNGIKAYKKGMNWKEARDFVLQNSFSHNAQYSPVNLGFQTIGFLYGKDFGDAICKAVNCGYDTDCTGATVGALLGIILGKKGLPKNWTEPLGDKITTNSSWGGITNLKEPGDLDELTQRVCRMGKKVLCFYEANVTIGKETVSKNIDLRLQADENIKKLWHASPTRVEFDLGTLVVSVDYLGSPVVHLGISKDFQIALRNSRPVSLDTIISVNAPEQWDIQPRMKKIVVKPESESGCRFSVKINDIRALNTTNQASLSICLNKRPLLEQVPLVFIAANRWLISKVFREGQETSALENNPEPTGINKGWTVASFPENELLLEKEFEGRSGIAYLRHYVLSPDARNVRVGLSSDCPFRMWLNGNMIHDVQTEGILRPNYSGDGRSYVDTGLREGWNQFFIKLVRKDNPVQAHFTMATNDKFNHGFTDLVEYKFPWEY